MATTTAWALLALSVAACRTADRLWRITPFEGGATSERVNLWPLAYHDGSETSVLWPLFDLDDQGFALRPLIAKDGPAYSVLYPLASFDTDDGTGWFVPFYKFDSNAGLFPVANFGKLSWVGLWWWTDETSGLFPVAQFGSTSYVGPLWWQTGDEPKGGLFPLATFASTSYVGPVWWSGGGSYGLFPLFGVDLFHTGIDHVGPVWWCSDEEHGSDVGLWPILDYGDGGRRFSLLPLYSHELGPDARTRNVLLGLGHAARYGEREERWLLPLYYQEVEPAKGDTVLLPFFWKHVRGDSARVYTLLGNRAVDPESSTFNLYPLWWSNENAREDSAWRMLFPFFYFERDGDARTLLTPLGGRGWSDSGTESFVNVLGPLYHHSENASRDESRTAFLWPLFERHRKGDERTTNLAGLYSATSTPGRSEQDYLFWLGNVERTPTGHSHRLWPLYSWSEDEKTTDVLYDWTLYGWRAHDGRESLRLFPLFSREAEPGRSSWSALFGLAAHEREVVDATRPGATGPGATEATISEHTRCWPLYARAQGDRPAFAEATALLGSSAWAGGRQFQLGCSLLYSRKEETDAAAERASSRALLFFTHQTEELHGAHVPAPEKSARTNRVGYASRGFLFDSFVSERSTYHVWREGVLEPEEASTLRSYAVGQPADTLPDRERARAILASHGAAPADAESDAEADDARLRAAVADFSAANTRTLEESHLRLPLLYSYERGEDELSWSGPLGLVHYSRAPERARFSLLYLAYRSERKGERTSRDIFPFITWDSGPDETHWSFLWHFLHYEHAGAKRGGHVLFIPWGDA